MGEIHELFVWALSLVWFAGATPDCSVDLRLETPKFRFEFAVDLAWIFRPVFYKEKGPKKSTKKIPCKIHPEFCF